VDSLGARAEIAIAPFLTRVQHTHLVANALKLRVVDGVRMLNTVASACQTQGQRSSVLHLELVMRG